jgi:hypothetical protein
VSRPRIPDPVGPRLKPWLLGVLGLFALLTANALYLLGVRLMGLASGQSYENRLYLVMFLVHLVLGVAILVPAVVFMTVHLRRAIHHPNRRAVRVGLGLLSAAILLLASGVVLMRVEGVLDIRNPTIRTVSWWIHVATPVAAAWLFVLHRLAGRRIRWRVGARWAVVAVALTAGLLGWQARDPRRWNEVGNPEGERYFAPSLARTATGDFILARVLDNDDYCVQCHPDIHARWEISAHRLSSFNNPPYLFSVRGTRRMSMERDGNVRASRFCAGCHDPVPFFSGRFSDPDYDDEHDPTSQSGITCTVCHAITNLNSPRGNSDYTIEEPIHYPFAFSDSPALRWVNRQLVKAKPEFHKKTFLKPLHRTPEFCATCHKVHLPEDLNGYKWLRGQNHYDSYLLSGVSGHGVASFYYPAKAEPNCTGCHMPLDPSDDFGSRDRDGTGVAKVHDHLFPSANTAIPVLTHQERADEAIAAHRAFLDGVLRVDIFGLREGGVLDGRLTAPLRPDVPELVAGRSYLLDVVIRTMRLGHLLTQGTADSNELWLDVTVRSGDRIIGRSGAMDATGRVDRWSHFINAWVLDREGRRIDRRNADDIFIPLYNHQIPPGAADTVHYRFDVPRDVRSPVEIEVVARYRKFDTTYMQLVYGADFVNDLPVTVLGRDRLVLPVAGGPPADSAQEVETPLWQRWNDYGIGLVRKSGRGELRQAENAFTEVERLGRPDGPLNLARVYVREGRVDRDAPQALARAANFDPAPPAWTLLWLTAQVKMQNGDLDGAATDLEQILDGGFEQAVGRGFDFSKDYRVLDLLGEVQYQQAQRMAEGEERSALLAEAAAQFEGALALDPENLAAHWGLRQIAVERGDADAAAVHGAAHARYKPDDNARDRAIRAARRADPAADHAAQDVVIYDLSRGRDAG